MRAGIAPHIVYETSQAQAGVQLAREGLGGMFGSGFALSVDVPGMAAVPVVVFSDFTCPFCHVTEAALRRLEDEGAAAPRYAAFDMLAGREVRVELDGQWQHGTALGLADDGALRVRIDGRERLLHAGEVSVRAA